MGHVRPSPGMTYPHPPRIQIHLANSIDIIIMAASEARMHSAMGTPLSSEACITLLMDECRTAASQSVSEAEGSNA